MTVDYRIGWLMEGSVRADYCGTTWPLAGFHLVTIRLPLLSTASDGKRAAAAAKLQAFSDARTLYSRYYTCGQRH
jgi:hypothetical protein